MSAVTMSPRITLYVQEANSVWCLSKPPASVASVLLISWENFPPYQQFHPEVTGMSMETFCMIIYSFREKK